MRGLTADNFEVRDNAVVQHVNSASSAAFVSAALLVDNTESLSDANLATLLEASRALTTVMQASDRVSLLTVNDTVARPLGSAGAPRDVAAALDNIRREVTARTPLLDAIASGASLIANDAGARVIFVASDGADNESWLTREQVEQLLDQSGMVVDWIATKSKSHSDHIHPDETSGFGAVAPPMDQLVLRTGGRTFQADATNLTRLLDQHLADLRSSYVLTYTPAGVAQDDGWHKIEVRLKNAKGDVRARPGYFATAPK